MMARRWSGTVSAAYDQAPSTIERDPSMPWMNFAAVGAGAALGAWTRWGLGVLLNAIHPALPLGTLTANLIGGFLIGIVMALAEPMSLSVTVRLLIVTGFLGGLTTFSSFSAETVGLVMKGEIFWTIVIVIAHVAGSLAMTGAGLMLTRTVLAR
jgi:fluoride exporter